MIDKRCKRCQRSIDFTCGDLPCDGFNRFLLTPPDTPENQSVNNGGSTGYYKFDPEWTEIMDIIEAREMNYAQGNILKAAMCFNTERHEGTNEVRELNKIIYFAKRLLKNHFVGL